MAKADKSFPPLRLKPRGFHGLKPKGLKPHVEYGMKIGWERVRMGERIQLEKLARAIFHWPDDREMPEPYLIAVYGIMRKKKV